MTGLTVDDLLAEIAPREVIAQVLLRQDLVAQHTELELSLQQALVEDARENRDSIGPGIAKQIESLEAEMDAHRRPFTFRAVGKRRWADLMAQHPPTKEQRKENPRLDHDPSLFPVVAIAASCIDPVLTIEQVNMFEDRLDLSQWALLWNACLEANLGDGKLPKSMVAGAIAQANAELEKRATGLDSHAASSSAE